MENEKQQLSSSKDAGALVYVIGAIVLVGTIAAAVLFWPKTMTDQKSVVPLTQELEQKTMISKLACEKQWFNPMIGFSKYYLSAEGEALESATGIDCLFNVIDVDGKLLAAEKQQAVLVSVPERGGKKFTCTTKAVELTKGAQVTIMTSIVDNVGGKADCAPGATKLP